MLWTNGIIRPIVSLMIYHSQWKTGRSTGLCANQNFLTWYISFVCISSRTYLHFMYINVCRHLDICVGMHAFASAHRYEYARVGMITHVFKCMLQHVIISPLIAIHVIFAFIYICIYSCAILYYNTFICAVYFTPMCIFTFIHVVRRLYPRQVRNEFS